MNEITIAIDLRSELERQERCLLKAANYVACSAEWFAGTKRVPNSEIRRHYLFCEALTEMLTGDPPVGKFDPPTVLARLAEVSTKLRERVGEAANG